jgi:predicted ferric reductase
MVLIARGIVWYGLYLFLVLLPLATAGISNPARLSQPLVIEIAVAASFIGYSLMALEAALISRIEAANEPFGEDSLQLFHNLMGTAALGFLLLHPILLVLSGYPANYWLNPFAACGNTATVTASLSLYVLLALVLTSIFRKRLGIKYELWYVLHGFFALFVVFASLVHISMIGRYTSTPVMQIVWAFYALLILGLMPWYKIIQPLRNWNKPWQVIENREENADARTLVLKPVGHDGWSFKPGQFAWIKAGATPFHVGQHPISMSSMGDVPPGGEVSFTIKNLGDWSGEYVPGLEKGDRLWLDGPHGVFTLERNQAMGFVFIASGVGITPLYSILQTMAARSDLRPVLLFYGAVDSASMTFKDELEELASSDRLNLQFIPVLQSPEEGWQGERGYISAEVMGKYVPAQYKRFHYMICGPKPLMDVMEVALPEAGMPPQNVITERFDMS